ncbi:MAG: cohesin domain-containing protein [Candidatus Parcubacteria bacterium]|nr:cohesin domain-containing protein [Candidatus Parcubacteria bacterium]
MEKKYLTLICAILLFFGPISAFSATLNLSPETGSHGVGEKFTVRVLVSSDAPFNAVSLSLLFPPSVFTLDSVSKTGSLLSFWVKEPSISKSEGTLKLEGVTPGGIKETTGMVVAVTMHGNSPGSGTVSFLSGQILANDGEGTNITGDMVGAKYTIVEAKPKPVVTPELIITPPLITTPVPVEPVSAPEVQQLAPTLNSPEIMLGAKYGEDAITGSSEYSKIQVLMTFVATDGSKIFIMGNTEEDGTFTFVVPHSLRRGDYTVMARVIQKDGLNSKDSNAVALTVGNPFSDMSWQVKTLFFLIFLFISILMLYLNFHFRKDREKHIIIEKEVEEAKDAVHESLDSLQKDIMEHLHDTSPDTDVKILTETSHDIEHIEKKIEKEIENIN